MLCFYEFEYDDLDRNRGVQILSYTPTEEDIEDIVKFVREYTPEIIEEDIPDIFIAYLWCHLTDNEIEVEIKTDEIKGLREALEELRTAPMNKGKKQ